MSSDFAFSFLLFSFAVSIDRFFVVYPLVLDSGGLASERGSCYFQHRELPRSKQAEFIIHQPPRLFSKHALHTAFHFFSL